MIGKEINGFRIIEKLGQGGMAEVYKAIDLALERKVAIKLLLANLEDVEIGQQRFKLEAKALAKLRHPNIVSVLGYGQHEDRPYLMMDYVPGGTLKDKLGKAMRWQEATALLAPVAEALHYAHSKNIVHRDVKPSNILLTEDGQPMLSDFGVAKTIGADKTTDLTGTGIGIGTPHYMSPEQVRGQRVGPKSDIYALGVVLYELVTGRKPYEADTPLAVLVKHLEAQAPRPTSLAKDLPKEAEQLIMQALSKSPGGRFRDAREMAAALAGQPIVDRVEMQTFTIPLRTAGEAPAAQRARPSAPRKSTEARREPRRPAAKWRLSSLVLMGGLAALALAAFFLLPGRQPAAGSELGENLAVVAELSGQVLYTLPGRVDFQPLEQGSVLEAGQGAILEVRGAGHVRLDLAGDATVALGDDTRIELLQIGSHAGAETIIYLLRGALLIDADASANRELMVRVPNDHAAARIKGTVMGVFYDSGGRRFQVDCLEGVCEVHDANGQAVELSMGEYVEIFGLGDVSNIQPARYEFWQDIAEKGLISLPAELRVAQATATLSSTSGSRFVQICENPQRDNIHVVALRVSPGMDAAFVIEDGVPCGKLVEVHNESRGADGLVWWRVTWNGHTGWMAERTRTGGVILPSITALASNTAGAPQPASATARPAGGGSGGDGPVSGGSSGGGGDAPPTNTPFSPTNTPVPPTATSFSPPTNTPEPSGGDEGGGSSGPTATPHY